VSAKILTLERADEWISAQRAAKRRIGFTCGSFDLLHAGHVQYLQEAGAACDVLLVAVNSDASIRRYKNPLRPINPLAERQYVLAALSSVAAVTTLDDDRPLRLILRWKPDLYIKGGDYAPEELRSSVAVREYGGETLIIPPRYSVSTSKLIERILALQLYAPPESADPGPRRIVFMDRDGTLIDDIHFLHEPDRVHLKSGVTQGLRDLRAAGFRLVIVTNQQGLGLGYFDMDAFLEVNQRLLREIGAEGAAIDRIYFCPHSQADSCNCRKPLPGMLERACRDFGVDASDCFLIGDSAADCEAGAAARIRTFVIGEDVSGFEEAVRKILAESR
jgi:rfaE bifunctional protein nucleotidyltransferase chain/domain